MARVISVFLPMWPVDRLRRQDGTPSDRPPERPLVLAGRIGNRRLLTAVDALAAGLGLRPGMPVSKAQALVPAGRLVDGQYVTAFRPDTPRGKLRLYVLHFDAPEVVYAEGVEIGCAPLKVQSQS